MENSNEKILNNQTILYTNIHNLLVAFQQATTSTDDVFVDLISPDDNSVIERVKVNSIQSVLNSLTRIDNNFKSLLNADNISYLVNADGSLSQVTKTTFLNSERITEYSLDSECIVDTENIIKQLMFPNVKIPVTINSTIKTPIIATMYNIIEGFDLIPENISLIHLKNLIQTGQIIVDEFKMKLDLEKEQIKLFGSFTVTSIVEQTGDIVKVALDKVTYESLNTVGNSIELTVNDLLVTKDGTAVYQITNIDKFIKQAVIKRIKGIGTVKPGIDELSLNSIVDGSDNIVGIPVEPNKKLVVFLSTENLIAVGYPSTGIKINTETYTVTKDNQIYTLDEYFNRYVTNVSEYLLSLIKETTIPLSLGIKPNQPILNPNNFKVVQINKHLTDAKSTKELEELNSKKEKIKNDIDYKNTQITQIQNEIDTQKFRSSSEKEYRINNIIVLKQDINVLNNNLLNVTRELNNNAISYGLKSVKPKYKILGFWEIQTPMFSPKTTPQNIIKYDVQYRYLSKNIDTVESISYKMINNEGKEVSVSVSPWNNLQTDVLNKVENVDGSLSWETQSLDSNDNIKINQLQISINEGESVEIRVRAISEAGYPISPIKSDWSEIQKIDFPNNLTESSLNSIVSKNEEDLKKSEFNDILVKSGMYKHIEDTVIEAERTFHHKADNIASGLFSEELKNISVAQALKNLFNEIDIIKNNNILNLIKVELIDFNKEILQVTNNSTIELSAGNYSDNINLLDSDRFGSIIRKTGFIKISNKNQVPIEVKTIVPGSEFNSVNASRYWNVPILNQDGLLQKSKQIIYFRNLDITGQNDEIFRLVKPHLPETKTYPNPIYIDNNASEDQKDIVYLDVDDTVKTCKLLPNAGIDFICFSKKHPLFNAEDFSLIKPEFERIKNYTAALKQPIWQEEPYMNDTLLTNIGFKDNDFYSIGENSVGAYLYPTISNINAISVVGNTTTSVLIVPENSEVIVPFIYEYRMMDAKGYINGNKDLTINDEVTYNKKIGIDMNINSINFRFDINVTSKLKSSVTPIDTLNVSSVTGNFNNEEQESLT